MMPYSDSASQVLWEDGERVFRRGWRLDDNGERGPVLIVLPAVEYPSRSSLDRLAHEYELRDQLHGAWAVRPLDLVHDAGRTVLVLEDVGGEPLEGLLGAPMEVGRFLRLAIGIAAALGKLHQRKLVHKDIKPANILVNVATDEVRLTGFGIASRLARERQSPHPPEAIAGTLAYMAPEQTGRMNRSIDSRSDLYALGVAFYQMLTGALPFTAADPMEWVHCHLAKRPVAPAELLKEIPDGISAIVMKLLTKTPEDRYQTAAGLETDLRICETEWSARRQVGDFPLGEHDAPNRLLIPEKLYGRRAEVETLLAAFDRIVKGGASELVLVSGYSGIGKSSVVNELQSALVSPRGLFASGKFDQYKRDIPYSTLAQAFQNLVRPLLGKSEADLAPWRDAWQEALGPNAALIADLVPEVKLIIGEPAPVPELPPQDAQRRFQMVFRRFLMVFARPEHPLALFLDDLQWLDAATLELLEDLLTQPDVRYLLLIGAYRDNEVVSTHPLTHTIDRIRSAGAPVQDIVLAPLAHGDVAQLVADSLYCDRTRAAPLAELVHGKTDGNPFFVIQFLTELVDEGLLTFDHSTAHWLWDLTRIHAKGYTDNVVVLMVGKISRLPIHTQKFLQQLACLGDSAKFELLAIAGDAAEEKLRDDLQEALQTELVVVSEGTCRFLHDRIREAAYSLIPEDQRAKAHLRLGKLLTTHIPPEQREEAIFEIVNQLNRGVSLITSPSERQQLAEFNLIAGKRAKASAAYVSALRYLGAGMELLPHDGWDHRPDLMFELEIHRAECEFLIGELEAADVRLIMLSSRAVSPRDQAAVTCLRVDLYAVLGGADRAVAVCLEYLRQVGIEWSPHPTDEDVRREYDKIWQRIGSRPIEDLIDLPLMNDAGTRATMDVLTKVMPSAQCTDEKLLCLTITAMVNLSLEYGNSTASCCGYVWLGLILSSYFDNYPAAHRFGQLGLDLVERRGLDAFRARVYEAYGIFVSPWAEHVRSGRQFVQRAFSEANRIGDLTYVSYCCNNLVTNSLASGERLSEVEREATEGINFAQKADFGLVVDIIRGQLRLIRTLRGLTRNLRSFDDAEFDERKFEEYLEGDSNLAIAACWYWIRKLQARVFAQDYASALEAAAKAQTLLWTSPAFFEQAEYHFYAALARAGSIDNADAVRSDQQSAHVEALATHYRQIRAWAEHCPENFENRSALVAAETARIEGRELDAERLYEAAIKSARENEFVHNAALANELAARFYAQRGLETIANAYLREARSCYLRWGAAGKVTQLDQLHPRLRQDERASGPTGTIDAPVEQLDLATVIKVSQAVSGEIVLEKLIERVVRTAIEHAGAERGVLLLSRKNELRQEAEATISGDTIIVRRRDGETVAAPESIVQYVMRTREIVILDDASAHPTFSRDSYVRERNARSILCLPLVNEARVSGVLYLENNLTSCVFTPNRIAVLKLMALQAAISLENTYLYSDLAEREAKIRRLVDANIVGIFIWDLEGRIIDSNDAFLQMVGYDRNDIASGVLRWTELTPVEWRGADEQRVADVKVTGVAQPYEKEFFKKDGSRVSILIGGAIFDGARDQGVSFVLDLTARNRADEALRESEAMFRDYAETASDWLWEIGPDYKFTLLTENAFGSDPAYRIGTACWDHALDLETEPEKWRLVRTTLDSRQPFRDFVYCTVGGNGSPMYVKASGKPVFGADGEFRGYRGTGTDVTAIVRAQRAEASLRTVQAELAHVSRVTTLGQLTASIAHEVNQPIAAALTNAQTALRWLTGQQPNLEKARQAIERIVSDGNRAAGIVDRVRGLIKKAPARKDDLRINEVILEVIDLTCSEMSRNGVLLQTQLAEDLPVIQGDRIQLQQVILNLIINAIEAMGQMSDGLRELLICTETEPGGVLVAVRDSGPGLSEASVGRAFEAFYTTKPTGLGMGLSICRSIIEAHGGRLWATANVPRGAAFQFTLLSHLEC